MRSTRTILPAALAAAALVVAFAAPAAPAVAAVAPVTDTAQPAPPAATTFATPLTTSRYWVSSYFGPRCMPVPGASTFHEGLDMAAPTGTPIHAIAAGVVVATVDGTTARAGYVKLRHLIGGVTYTSIYYHIWKSTTDVAVGQVVAAGQRISEVGSSGVSSGSHLHLEIWKGEPGAAVLLDPEPFMKAHGIDLYRGAKAITATRPPATCTYYTTALLNFRTGPSTATTVIRTLALGTAVVQVPGQATNGFLPVRVGGQSGWVASWYVSPFKPAPPAPKPMPTPTPSAPSVPAPAGLPVTPPVATPAKPPVATPPVAKPVVKPVAKPAAKPATYRTTTALNLRTSPSLKGARILVIPRGADIGTVRATSGVWRKVVYKGRTGWVHSAYIVRR